MTDQTLNPVATGGHNPPHTDREWGDTESSERQKHYNPRVAEALTKMVGMGFTDDDGWLTQLLVMKHGDISQV